MLSCVGLRDQRAGDQAGSDPPCREVTVMIAGGPNVVGSSLPLLAGERGSGLISLSNTTLLLQAASGQATTPRPEAEKQGSRISPHASAGLGGEDDFGVAGPIPEDAFG